METDYKTTILVWDKQENAFIDITPTVLQKHKDRYENIGFVTWAS